MSIHENIYRSIEKLMERKFQYQLGLKITFLPELNLKWFENGKAREK
jgi:hypothetical protein